MIEERVFSDEALPLELKCQVLSFMRMEWADGFAGANRLRDWITRPERHPLHFILVEKDLVISYAGMVWEMLEHAGEMFKAYGLSGVFTYPAFRGEGHGSRIVERATRYIQASDADVAILTCVPARKNFYGRIGWIPTDRSPTLVGEKERPAVFGEARMMLFVSEKGKQAQSQFESEPLYFPDPW